MITLSQLDDVNEFTQADVDAMNKIAAGIAEHFGVGEAGLGKHEHNEIIGLIESYVSANFDREIGLIGSADEALPPEWKRLLAGRMR